jgi:uncharacterized membrane protein
MKLQDYRLILIAVGLIGTILIASPELANVISVPGGEQFSEFYLLGPNKMAENYPYNLVIGQNYTVYVETTNHLGSSTNYILYLKLKNQTDVFPDSNTVTPSSLPPLYEKRYSVEDGKSFESPITFSIESATFSQDKSIIKNLVIDNYVFEVDKPSGWNTNSSTFSYQILFELWIYNAQTQSIEFNNRYLNLQLNLTAAM